MEKKRKLTILLPQEYCQRIQELADESFRTRSGYIRRVITAYLCEIERDPEKKIM